jgi:uncharacterized membrane protein
MPTARPRLRHPLLPFRVMQAQPRLFTSAAIGIALTALLAAMAAWDQPTRLLVGWDVGVLLYLVLVYFMMANSDVGQIRRHAADQDAGRLTMLVLTVAAALASLIAIFAELSSGAGPRRPSQLALASGTILLSWALIHSMFALHYAHEYYDEIDGGGLAFPGDDRAPDYWDFVYFAFVIGMTSQVSDVGITGKGIRRTAAAHGIVSFMFNAALLALTVNIAASAI